MQRSCALQRFVTLYVRPQRIFRQSTVLVISHRHWKHFIASTATTPPMTSWSKLLMHAHAWSTEVLVRLITCPVMAQVGNYLTPSLHSNRLYSFEDWNKKEFSSYSDSLQVEKPGQHFNLALLIAHANHFTVRCHDIHPMGAVQRHDRPNSNCQQGRLVCMRCRHAFLAKVSPDLNVLRNF